MLLLKDKPLFETDTNPRNIRLFRDKKYRYHLLRNCPAVTTMQTEI